MKAKKYLIVLILRILETNTDKDHPLTQVQITEMISAVREGEVIDPIKYKELMQYAEEYLGEQTKAGPAPGDPAGVEAPWVMATRCPYHLLPAQCLGDLGCLS